nr:helix-turn-helix domain-containing protein [Ruegeria arenilitoris]
MARAFGMSVRTYRRHLKRLGLSHRQLVSDARLSKAEAMLADPSISITEISFELGYANSPAFNVSSEPERDEHRRNLGQITCDSRFGRLNALDTIFAYAIQCTQ